MSYSAMENKYLLNNNINKWRIKNKYLPKRASQNLYSVNEQDSSLFILSHVQILVKTTDSWGYFDSTVGYGYVAKPRLSLRLYNYKTQGIY